MKNLMASLPGDPYGSPRIHPGRDLPGSPRPAQRLRPSPQQGGLHDRRRAHGETLVMVSMVKHGGNSDLVGGFVAIFL